MLSSSTVPVILGASKFGRTNEGGIPDRALAQQFVDIAIEHGSTGLDTARAYAGGESEKMISTLDLKGIMVVDTKVFHLNGGLKASRIKEQVKDSIAALNGIPIRVLYWHGPDRNTPFEESLQAMDELHKEGIFQEFGISNMYAWEVAEIATICRERGWVRPTVYEGIYNAIDRVVEDELFPCLRKFGIRFAAYSPLAGGLLTGFHLEDPDRLKNNIRFNPELPSSAVYMPRYAHSKPVLERVKVLADKHGISLQECAIRWLVNHSHMRANDHGVIYGGSKLEQIRSSLIAHTKGPLPELIVKEFDDGWVGELKGKVPSYGHD